MLTRKKTAQGLRNALPECEALECPFTETPRRSRGPNDTREEDAPKKSGVSPQKEWNTTTPTSYSSENSTYKRPKDEPEATNNHEEEKMFRRARKGPKNELADGRHGGRGIAQEQR